jgi:hypothetical protein
VSPVHHVSPIAGLVLAAAAATITVWLLRRAGRRAAPVIVSHRQGGSPLPWLLLLGIVVAGMAGAASKPSAARHTAVKPPRTVTQYVTRYVPVKVPVHNWPVNGIEIVLMVLGCLIAAVFVTKIVGRYFGR